ncbi:GNAT family N-acetyltransferase [Streptomyces sp. NBC_01235]|uniref:GNAT family N-acetyltransferase n=1 Tax=Streptomyces sp. NBC_01235 TaxID=2903788 RepID=UPI002E164C4A|nr:N-acetyltransferase [Streptomyces sp. NBC_01235]
MTTSTRDNPAENRYEIHDDGRLAGFSAYKLTEGRVAFTHTETLPEFAGRGMARQLVTDALDDVRRRGLAVLPFCPYMRKVIAQNPDAYLDLVPEEHRDYFGLPHTETA